MDAFILTDMISAIVLVLLHYELEVCATLICRKGISEY